MLKFRRISVSVLQVITFKRTISSTLVNVAEWEPHNHAMFLRKSIILTSAKFMRCWVYSIYGINLKPSGFFHLVRHSRQSGEDTRSQLWSLLDISTVRQLEQVVFNPDLVLD